MSLPQSGEPKGKIQATFIFVAPKTRSGGVGDYSDDFGAAASRLFSDTLEVRTGGPGQVSIADLLRDRRNLSRLLKKSAQKGPVVLHFELSAGSLSPFWLLAGSKGTITTATVHDPPFSVWWPFRSRLVSKNKWINHGIHFPLRAISLRLERFVLTGTTLFALSDLGAEALREKFSACEVLSARHFVPQRPEIQPAADRPAAVGLFGHAYRGKGFDRLQDLRRALPASVGIRVAGRGTERLPQIPGVTILGGVDGIEEDRFFESVRAILLPYANTSRYGEILSVSGVAARAFAYGTPVIASNSGTLSEAAQEGGLVTAPNDVDSIAALAFETVTDRDNLERLELEVEQLRDSRPASETVLSFVKCWEKVASPAQN